MAGDWIKLEHATPDKPEIDQLASIMEIDHDAAFGKCMRLWIWADQQSVSGDALSVTGAFIDRLVFCVGFSEGLRKVGWLSGRDGRLAIPNFCRHNGETAKKRALSKNRNAVKRKRDASSVTNASPEKRREEKSYTHSHSPREKPKSRPRTEYHGPDPHPAWADAWHRWVESWEGRTERRFDPVRAQIQIGELHSRPPDKAKRDLEFSLEKYAKNVLDSDDDWTKRKNAKTNVRSKLDL